MISIQNLHFSYKKHEVFTGIEAILQPGQIYGILGRNGTGKSTLLYNIAGLLHPQIGKVNVFGSEPQKREATFLQDIFMVPEEFYLPDIPINKFIKHYSPFYPKFDRNNFFELIRYFDIPQENTLQGMSYGQKKKVLISFGIATNTSTVLMDEPTNGLDIISKAQVKKIIAGAIDENKCFLISSHQVHDLENLIDEVLIINETKIILKQSLCAVAAKLSFEISFGNESDRGVIYSEPLLHGNTIVKLNTSGKETRVDLELLYKATMAHPQKMQSILDN